MAPVATETNGTNGVNSNIAALKAQNGHANGGLNRAKADTPFNPFYSPPSTDDIDDAYEYARYKVRTYTIHYSPVFMFLVD